MQKQNKKIKLIALIFFIFIFSSVILGINYFKITKDKWTVVYRMSVNTKSLNSLKFVDYELKKYGYISKEESIQKDIVEYINFNNHQNLLNPKIINKVKNFEATATYIKFQINDIKNIDNYIDDLLFKLNKNINKKLVNYLLFAQTRVGDFIYNNETQKIEDLEFRLKKIKSLIDFQDTGESERIINILLFNIIASDLAVPEIQQRNPSAEIYNVETNILDFNLQTDSKKLINYLERIIQLRKEKLKSLIKNPNNLKNINAVVQIIDNQLKLLEINPYLVIRSVEIINKKPTKHFIIFGFILVGLIFSFLVSCIVIFEKSLRRQISKMLATLLNQE